MSKKKEPLVIIGTSKKDGNTYEAVKMVIDDKDIPIVELEDLEISYFDYDHCNSGDDFLPLAEKMVMHETIILATPVYWYSMSGIMKTFIDRWSDLLSIRKDLGRGLKGTKMYLISSYGTSFPEAFEVPFRDTCKYLNMKYCGAYFHYSGNDKVLKEKNLLQAEKFSETLFKGT